MNGKMCDGRRRRRWMDNINLDLGIIFATRGTVFIRLQKATYCRMRKDNYTWMMDRVKDIGANRRGLFYCIRIGLRNSSRSSVFLSQSNTELPLRGVQSSGGLSILVGVCCCIPRLSNVLPLRHSAHLLDDMLL